MDRGRSSYRGRRSRDRDRERRPEYHPRRSPATDFYGRPGHQGGGLRRYDDRARSQRMTEMAEGMNAEVMTLISLHMTATDVILNNAPPRKRMNPSQLY